MLYWLAALSTFSAIAMSASSLYISINAMHPLPYDDHWVTVIDYRNWMSGDFGFRDLFRLHSEHRIPVSRLFYLADYHWFNGSGSFLILCIYALQFTHACLLAWILERWTGLAGPRLWTAVGVIFSLMMSAAQATNFSWSFQVHFPLVFLGASVAFLLTSLAARRGRTSDSRRRGIGLLAGAIVASLLATFSIANGLLVWPLLLLLGLFERMPRHQGILLLLSCFSTWTAFFVGSSKAGSGRLTAALADPIGWLHFVILYLGGPIARIRSGGTSALEQPFPALGDSIPLVVGGGVLLLTLLAAVQLLRRREGDPLDVTCTAIAIFILATAGVTALGRMDMAGTVEYALQSRYATASLVGWSALFVLACNRTNGFPWKHQSHRRVTTLVTTCVILSLLSLLWWRQAREIPYASARLTYVEGLTRLIVDGPLERVPVKNIVVGQPWLFLPSIAFLKDQELGIFHDWGSQASSDTPARGFVYQGLHLVSSGDWGLGMSSVYHGFVEPFEGATVFGTWNAGSGGRGRLELSGFQAIPIESLALSYVTGPTVKGLVIRAINGDTGEVVGEIALSPAPSGWRAASIPIPSSVPASALRLVAVDDDPGSQAWLGIALPPPRLVH